MIGAIEKQKLVYILNRDNEARLTISSPLEAHKSSTLTYHMVGVDVGFENPMFACLEIDYEKADSDPTGKIRMFTREFVDCSGTLHCFVVGINSEIFSLMCQIEGFEPLIHLFHRCASLIEVRHFPPYSVSPQTKFQTEI